MNPLQILILSDLFWDSLYFQVRKYQVFYLGDARQIIFKLDELEGQSAQPIINREEFKILKYVKLELLELAHWINFVEISAILDS